jgi:hypothetical protein
MKQLLPPLRKRSRMRRLPGREQLKSKSLLGEDRRKRI